MDWQTLSIIMVVWTTASFPFALLVGRALAYAGRFDETDDMRMYCDRQALLPAPSILLPASWSVAHEISSVRA